MSSRMGRRQLLVGLAGATLGCKASRAQESGGEIAGALDATAGAIRARPRAAARYLLIGDRLARLRRRARAGDAAWSRLLKHVGAELDAVGDGGPGAENLAVAHLVSQNPLYARAALSAARRAMERDVRAESYLHFGDILRPVALVLDHCGAVLSEIEARELADFLADWAHELWFDNRGSGWGLDDPGNNYHMAFLEGTAFAAHALAKRRDQRARRLLKLLRQKIEAEGGVLSHLASAGAGGDWHEGANYGQRAKQRLLSAWSAIATMGGPRYFDKTDFVADLIRYAVYQLQPDGESLYPGGDLARDSAMRVSPYDRDYIQLATYWVKDEDARALGRWYLKEIAPSYQGGEGRFDFSEALYKDLLFAPEGSSSRSPQALPTAYLASGTSWVNVRSGWDRDAASLCVSGCARLEQSHAHLDTGAFTLFKGGWQAVDAATLSRSGLTWEAGAHNLVHVHGHERRGGEIGGLSRFHHEARLTYMQIDATNLYRRREERHTRILAEDYTRELVWIAPDTLVVYDRVTVPSKVRYEQRTHFAERPEHAGDGLYRATHGRGAMTLRILLGGEHRIASDADLRGGGSRAWRVEVEPAARPGEFLTVLRVGLGPPPAIDAARVEGDDGVRGVILDEHVVIFSARAGGAPLAERWGYRVPADRARAHWIFDAQGRYDVRVVREGGVAHVLMRPGSAHAADAHGIVRLQV